MPQDILDKPIPEGEEIKLRYFFSTPIEFILIITNISFILVGVGICWYIAFQNIADYWLLIINPTIFIVLFGLAPLSIVWKWRKCSLHYQETQDLMIFDDSITAGVGGFNIIPTFIFNAIFLFLLLGGHFEDYYPSVLLILFGIMGPLQTLYIFLIKREIKYINN